MPKSYNNSRIKAKNGSKGKFNKNGLRAYSVPTETVDDIINEFNSTYDEQFMKYMNEWTNAMNIWNSNRESMPMPSSADCLVTAMHKIQDYTKKYIEPKMTNRDINIKQLYSDAVGRIGEKIILYYIDNWLGHINGYTVNAKLIADGKRCGDILITLTNAADDHINIIVEVKSTEKMMPEHLCQALTTYLLLETTTKDVVYDGTILMYTRANRNYMMYEQAFDAIHEVHKEFGLEVCTAIDELRTSIHNIISKVNRNMSTLMPNEQLVSMITLLQGTICTIYTPNSTKYIKRRMNNSIPRSDLMNWPFCEIVNVPTGNTDTFAEFERDILGQILSYTSMKDYCDKIPLNHITETLLDIINVFTDNVIWSGKMIMKEFKHIGNNDKQLHYEIRNIYGGIVDECLDNDMIPKIVKLFNKIKHYKRNHIEHYMSTFDKVTQLATADYEELLRIINDKKFKIYIEHPLGLITSYCKSTYPLWINCNNYGKSVIWCFFNAFTSWSSEYLTGHDNGFNPFGIHAKDISNIINNIVNNI